MKHVIIAGFNGALSTAITGVLDILSLTGVSWELIQSESPVPKFKVWIASADGLSIKCINNVGIEAHMSFAQVMGSEQILENLIAIIVPTVGSPIEYTLAKNPKMKTFLQWGYARNLMIAGNCTGNFFLAEAGLLDGKRATTHWGYKEVFEARYPQVDLRADQLITVDGNIYCAGGGLAWLDLGIYIIEKELGYNVALQTAKAFVIDYRRENQSSYSLARLAQNHHDALIEEVQTYFEDYYHQSPVLDEVSAKFNVSKRTLIRRFKAALNITPYSYLQRVRIEAAQKLLTETQFETEKIVLLVGYEDMSSFRRLFKQHTGLTLSVYRSRFAKRI
ncbi:MAG: transcriptional regulator GlxA family with amidase domain [Oleiphilaceae bacterium]|jgi:transcriptional regulator GlxA family with amidase domain